MKRLISLFYISLFCLSLSAQEGIYFQDLSFEEALLKAKHENKLVFLDCYTSWCGPCKSMAKKVFTLKEAGDFFNPRFINLKMDMEKGEGRELAEKYEVWSYPTFLLIRPDGMVQHRIVGAADWQPFKARIEKGMNRKTSLDYLQRCYEEGKLNKQEKAFYYQVLDEAGYDRKAEEIYRELMPLLSDEEKLSEDYWFLLENTMRYGSPDFPFVVENLKKLKKNVGKDRVDAFWADYYWPVIARNLYASGTKDTLEVMQLQQELRRIEFAEKENCLDRCEWVFIVARKDIPSYLDLLDVATTWSAYDAMAVVVLTKSLHDAFSEADKKRIATALKKIWDNAEEDDKEGLKPYMETYL